ncbi:MAG: prephenate dehydratase domain-containing protein [Chitinophagales bacterium]
MRKIKAAMQGSPASFHEKAARTFLSDEVESVYCRSFRSSCEKVKNGEADFCVMAIGNSIAGAILTNYDLIREYNLHITGEQYLRIELHLMVLNGSRMEDIEQIHSHPVAIQQSEKFLLQFPEKKIMALNDTAECARNVTANNLSKVAVIAGEECAETYGMTIISRNIESKKKNYTRFLILSGSPDTDKLANKATVSFKLKKKQSNLESVTKIFAGNDLKVTTIHSLQDIDSPARFYVDLEFAKHKKFRKSIDQLQKKTSFFSLHGTYRRATI